MEKLILWIHNFEKMNGKLPSSEEILSQAEMVLDEEKLNLSYEPQPFVCKCSLENKNKRLKTGEDSLYRSVFDFVNNNIPSGTQISVSGVGGGFLLPNGCQIKFIPHTEKHREDELRKGNTKYYIVKYLKDIMSIETTELLKENVNKYVDENYYKS